MGKPFENASFSVPVLNEIFFCSRPLDFIVHLELYCRVVLRYLFTFGKLVFLLILV